MLNNKILLRFGSGVVLVMILWIIRMLYTGSYFYRFLLWNLFLAFIPYCISAYLLARTATEKSNGNISWKSYLLFAAWLLFFPNAPYVITDLLHLTKGHAAPKWFDMALLFYAGSTGIWIGYVSLLQMEVVWRRKIPSIRPVFFVAGVLLLSGFGIYLGRVLRFNSWDVVTNPVKLSFAIGHRVLLPWQHSRTWGVTLLFAILLWLGYQQTKFFLQKQISYS